MFRSFPYLHCDAVNWSQKAIGVQNLTHFTCHHHYHCRMTRRNVLGHHTLVHWSGVDIWTFAKITHNIQFRFWRFWPYNGYGVMVACALVCVCVYGAGAQCERFTCRAATHTNNNNNEVYMNESILIIASNWSPKWNTLKTPPTITHRIHKIHNKKSTHTVSSSSSTNRNRWNSKSRRQAKCKMK